MVQPPKSPSAALPLLEVCVDDAPGLDAAVGAGAGRIELCSALALGGLTPSAGLMARAAKTGVPVMAMIRPRGGEFCFTETEVEQMLAEIDAVRAAGLTGVVLGANLPDNRLDLAVLKRLCAHAEGLDKTLHRAFDLVPDQAQALEEAIDLGFSRVLTSGAAVTGLAGIERIRQLAEQATGRIGILPGGGISAETAAPFLALPGIHELHASGSRAAAPASEMAQQFGFDLPGRRETHGPAITALLKVMRGQ